MTEQDVTAASLVRGIEAASATLRQFSNGRVSIDMPDVRTATPAAAAAELGPPDDVVVGIYVGFEGGLSGHALLLMTPDGADRVSRHLLIGNGLLDPGSPGSEPSPELHQSALEELGNVVISAVLNELGRDTPTAIHPMVPQAVTEMAGAILDGVLASLVSQTDEVTVARSVFRDDGDAFDGWLLVLPRASAIADRDRSSSAA